jgi:hypothetical protein
MGGRLPLAGAGPRFVLLLLFGKVLLAGRGVDAGAGLLLRGAPLERLSSGMNEHSPFFMTV